MKSERVRMLAVWSMALCASCAGSPADDDGAESASALSSVALETRFTACEALDAIESDPNRPWRQYRYSAIGRLRDPQPGGPANERALFTSEASCERVPERPMPKAYFYGNLGTWGWLGLDDRAGILRTEDDVVGRFDELCHMARDGANLGERMPCHADLITATPRGYVRATESVARKILERKGATVSIDIRTSSGVSWSGVMSRIVQLFEGKTSALSKAFLEEHAVGLSLDLEPQIGPTGAAGLYSGVQAATVNAFCDAYRQRMLALGHDSDKLTCFLYEYAKPTMVNDPENLAPYVFPVLMSVPTDERVMDELAREGAPRDSETRAQRGIEIQRRWIDLVKAKYPADRPMGCMFFVAPYLQIGERTSFDYPQGVRGFGNACDIYSFQ